MNLELGTENADVCDICAALNKSPKPLRELMSEFPRKPLKTELTILLRARLIDCVPVAEEHVTTNP